IREVELLVDLALLAQKLARRHPHLLQQIDELLPARRMLQVLDHLHLHAALLQKRQRLARGAALGVVVDAVHGPPSTLSPSWRATPLDERRACRWSSRFRGSLL